MKTLDRSPTGRARKRDVIDALRRQILSGAWPPGARIPTKLELARELEVSDGTVQKALSRLKRQGFLLPRGRLGTFVRQSPPNLCRFAILNRAPEGGRWTDAIAAVARAISREGSPWLDCYFGIGLQNDGEPSPGLHRLEADLREHLVAGGIVFAEAPEGVERLNDAHLPFVRVGRAATVTGHPCVVEAAAPDAMAMALLQREGRRRLAIISTFNRYGDACRELLDCARAHGLETRHCWIHYFNPNGDISARAVTELLMSLPPRKRPDALYITDDHLVSEAVRGLADSGVCVPRDLTVIAHANFPNPPQTALPVTFLGPDIDRILREAVRLLEDRLAGRDVPALTRIDWVFRASASG